MDGSGLFSIRFPRKDLQEGMNCDLLKNPMDHVGIFFGKGLNLFKGICLNHD
jgi:hypothetical protein